MNNEPKELYLTRSSGDTYPIKFDVQSNGDRVNLSGWDIFLEYSEVEKITTTDPETRERTTTINELAKFKITGVVTDQIRGLVSFYPGERFSNNILDSEDVFPEHCLIRPGDHRYKVYRSKTIYYLDENGTYVTEDNGNTFVLFDNGNPEHIDLDKYIDVLEIQTHFFGEIKIISNPGS